jgi:xanthosine utilization system XapX-like protein
LGGAPKEKASLIKITVLGNHDKAICLGKFSGLLIRVPPPPVIANVGAARKFAGEKMGQFWREILVKKQLHAAAAITMRSRSAVNAGFTASDERVHGNPLPIVHVLIHDSTF